MNRRTFVQAAVAAVALPCAAPHERLDALQFDAAGLPLGPHDATWDEWAHFFSRWERDAFRSDKPWTWHTVREQIVCRWNDDVASLVVMNPDQQAHVERDAILERLEAAGIRTLGKGQTADRYASLAFVYADKATVLALVGDWILPPPRMSWEDADDEWVED